MLDLIKSMFTSKISNLCRDVDLELYCKDASESIIRDACCSDYGWGLKELFIGAAVVGLALGTCCFCRKLNASVGCTRVVNWLCGNEAVAESGISNEGLRMESKV